MMYDGNEWLIGNINDFDEEAYQRMYDALSLFGKRKVDSAICENHRRQRTLAYFLLRQIRGGATEQEGYALSSGEHYSITHSGAHVAIAVCKTPVGVDVEEWKRADHNRLSKLGKSHFFTSEERRRLPDANEKEFFRVWTFKEAMTKMTGIPLATMLGMVDYYEVIKKSAAFGEDDASTGCFFFEWNKKMVRVDQWEDDEVVGTVCAYVSNKKDPYGS